MDTVLQFILKYTTIYFNLGLATGLVCGALLLLRPVLVRFLSPRQRLLLWATVWLSAYIPNWYEIFSWLHILPVTFRDLITPRTSYDLDSVPMYLPVYEGTGSYHVALPGGHARPWRCAGACWTGSGRSCAPAACGRSRIISGCACVPDCPPALSIRRGRRSTGSGIT